jgi:hypothetical protein
LFSIPHGRATKIVGVVAACELAGAAWLSACAVRADWQTPQELPPRFRNHCAIENFSWRPACRSTGRRALSLGDQQRCRESLIQAIINPSDQIAASDIPNKQKQVVGDLIEMTVSQAVFRERAAVNVVRFSTDEF